MYICFSLAVSFVCVQCTEAKHAGTQRKRHCPEERTYRLFSASTKQFLHFGFVHRNDVLARAKNMADEEQFSLCWNNFNANLSAGFHESLCRGDLVDVTLAAEGQLVRAHRLVLSVCSPYFRKMFTQMPANQHAFVFLKDVSHTALKDLIQFMYCGEVNVKQDALPTFISTAEALQIKGLTETVSVFISYPRNRLTR